MDLRTFSIEKWKFSLLLFEGQLNWTKTYTENAQELRIINQVLGFEGHDFGQATLEQPGQRVQGKGLSETFMSISRHSLSVPSTGHCLLTDAQPWFLSSYNWWEPRGISELKSIFKDHLFQWLLTSSGSWNLWESEVSQGSRPASTVRVKFQESHTWGHLGAHGPQIKSPNRFDFHEEMRKLRSEESDTLLWCQFGS